MNCHYTKVKGLGKVLIPGCWQVVNSNNIKDCICRESNPHLAYIDQLKAEGKTKEAKEYQDAYREMKSDRRD